MQYTAFIIKIDIRCYITPHVNYALRGYSLAEFNFWLRFK